MKNNYGILLSGKKYAFLKTEIGSATKKINDKDYSFQLAIDYITRSPIIYCKETNKYFGLNWNDLLNLAVDSGIIKLEAESDGG